MSKTEARILVVAIESGMEEYKLEICFTLAILTTRTGEIRTLHNSSNEVFEWEWHYKIENGSWNHINV